MFRTQVQQVLHSQFNLLASFKTFFYAKFFWPRAGDTFEAKECLKARNGAESFGRVLPSRKRSHIPPNGKSEIISSKVVAGRG